MAKPSRNSSPNSVPHRPRTYFVSSRTYQGKAILQSKRMAQLLIDVLKSYTLTGKFKVHEFVIMPNHIHLLLSLDESMTIEEAMQLVKGNFSYRVRKELGFLREVWQRGFSDVRIQDRNSYLKHVDYINQNSVKAGLAKTPEEYPFCSAYFRKLKRNKQE